jgi:tetratricopeptide (TPR) repeat protein
MLINVGSYEEAIKTCKNYLSSYGEDLRMYENLAYCYIKKLDYHSALDYINKAIPLCKSKADLLADKKAKLAILYYGNGNIDEMKRLVDEINALEKQT